MRALHLCFWLHHPYELRNASDWQKGYYGGEDDFKRHNQQDYQPLFALLERNTQRYSNLRVSLVVSGVWLEQAERWDNTLIKRLKKLVQSGNVGLVATPYYYSMAAFYDLDELSAQLKQYQEKIQQLFGVQSEFLTLPRLCYNNRIARWADKQGYKGVLAGDATTELSWRTCNRLYEAKGTDGLKVIFENRKLTEIITKAQPEATVRIATTKKVEAEDTDIAPESELSAADFVRGMAEEVVPANEPVKMVEKVAEKTEFSARKFQKQLDLGFLRGDLINLFLDTEIFAKWRELGIIGFFDELFKIWQDLSGSHLVSVREIAKLSPVAEVSIKKTASDKMPSKKDYQLPEWWTTTQDNNSQELYNLRKRVVASEDKDLYYDFGKLTTLEHAGGGAGFAAVLKDLQERTDKLVSSDVNEKAEPVRFGLSESTSVQINFDSKAKEAKERNRSFYQQMKAAAGDSLWTAEDLDDMEAAVQVMAQRMKMSHLEKERDFADFAEAEIVGTEDDFADWPLDDIELAEEKLKKEVPAKGAKNTKTAKDSKSKKSFKKIVID